MAKTLITSRPAPHLPAPAASGTTAVAGTCIISSRIGTADRQAVLDLFTRSSADTRRERFHGALSVFPQRYLEEILGGRQLALVARDTCHEESRDKVFGLASAAPIEPGIAEFAVWVEDAYQGHGVGSLLVRAILQLLAEHGICTAIGIMEPDNLVIRRLVSRIAPGAATRSEDGMIVVSIPLKASTSLRSSRQAPPPPDTDLPQAAGSNFSSSVSLEPGGTGYVENLVRL